MTIQDRRVKNAERMRRWRARNPEKSRAIAAAGRQRHRAKRAAAWKIYYQTHKPQLYEKKKAYVARNPDKLKRWRRTDYERHSESYKARAHRRWREKNEKCRAYEAKRYVRDKAAIFARHRDYVNRNAENIRAWRRAYFKTPKGRAVRLASDRRCVKKANARKNAWARRHPHKIAAHIRVRRRTDPTFRLKMDVRGRINQALCGKAKLGRTVELLGCSIAFYREYLTKLFLPGMSWEPRNFDIHHNQEISTFHLTTIEGQKAAFNYLNTRPLFRADHINYHKQRRANRIGVNPNFVKSRALRVGPQTAALKIEIDPNFSSTH
jgi:hypothetical protein